MGSNDNRFGDRRGGSREWGSKARKHETNARRRALEDHAITDSVASNSKGIECPCGCGHYEACNDYLGYSEHHKPTPVRKRKKASQKWCRRKEGREHQYVKFETSHFLRRYWTEYRCEVCGHKHYDWGKLRG